MKNRRLIVCEQAIESDNYIVLLVVTFAAQRMYNTFSTLVAMRFFGGSLMETQDNVAGNSKLMMKTCVVGMNVVVAELWCIYGYLNSVMEYGIYNLNRLYNFKLS